MNSDANQTLNQFQSVAADTELQFCMALEDENGNTLAEPGIMRWTNWGGGTQSTNFIDGTIKPTTIQDPTRFFNVWSINLTGGLLGYAQFPSNSGLGGLNTNGGSANTDGSVVLYSAMGSLTSPGGAGSFGLGRTLTHEVGHSYGLRHIWGDSNCGNDFCNDTPTQQTSSSGCPNSSTCGTGTDMTQNYMDYSNDACMNLFSLDQKARIDAVLNNSPRRPYSTGVPTLCQQAAPQPPITGFSSLTQTICAGNSITFSDESSNAPTNWTWNLPGATPSTSTQQNPQVTYNNPGTYTVTLTASNSFGSGNAVTQTNYITVIDCDPGPGCADETNMTTGNNLIVDPVNNTGYITGHNPFADIAKAEYFDNLAGQSLQAVNYFFGVATGSSTANVTFRIWDDNGGNYTNGGTTINYSPGTVLATTTVSMAQIISDVNEGNATYVDFGTAISFTGPVFIGYEVDNGNGTQLALYSTSDGGSGTPSTAWEQWSDNNWYPFNDGENNNLTWELDVAMNIEPIICGSSVAPPVAEFSASSTSICAGESISFSDLSTNGPTGWTWNFGGGASNTTQQNPTVTFNSPGTYTVTLTASNSGGNDNEVKTSYITVNAIPSAPNLSGGNTYCSGDNVTALSASGSNITWYSNANGTGQLGTGSTYLPSSSASDVYYATQTVNGCESTTASVTVTINATPNAPSLSGANAYCAGDNVSDLTASGSNITWYSNANGTGQLGTGNIYSPSNSATDTYYATQTVNGCESTTASVTVTINATPNAPSVSGGNTYCSGDNVANVIASGTNITWYSNANGTGQLGTGSSYTPSATTTDTYYATQTTNGCESATSSVTVTINSTPAAPSVSGANTYCDGDNVSNLVASGTNIVWYSNPNATGQLGTGNSYTPSATSTDTYYATQTSNGCESATSSATVTINTTPTVPPISGTSDYCEGDNVTALNATGSNIIWYSNANATGQIGTGNSYTPSATVSDTYYATQTVGGCESATNSISVSINAAPSAPSLSGGNTYCEGDNIANLTATGANIVWFSNANGTGQLGTGNVYSPSTTTSDTYYATQTIGGCESVTASQTVTINAAPSVSITGLPGITSSGTPITLSGAPSGGSFSGPGVVFNSFNPTLAGPGQHDITYTYTDGNGCEGLSTETIVVFTISYNFVNYNLGTISPKKDEVPEIQDNQILIFPNPVINDFEININDVQTNDAEIIIYGVDGQIIFNQSIPEIDLNFNKEFDLSGYEKGMYLLELKAGKQSVFKKIIKQ